MNGHTCTKPQNGSKGVPEMDVLSLAEKEIVCNKVANNYSLSVLL